MCILGLCCPGMCCQWMCCLGMCSWRIAVGDMLPGYAAGDVHPGELLSRCRHFAIMAVILAGVLFAVSDFVWIF